MNSESIEKWGLGWGQGGRVKEMLMCMEISRKLQSLKKGKYQKVDLRVQSEKGGNVILGSVGRLLEME